MSVRALNEAKVLTMKKFTVYIDNQNYEIKHHSTIKNKKSMSFIFDIFYALVNNAFEQAGI